MPVDTAAGILTPSRATEMRSATESSAPTTTHDAPANSARNRTPRENNRANAKAAKERLNAVGRDMSAGKYTSREQSVVEDDQTAHNYASDRPSRDAREVSDSPGIAPTPDPKPAPAPTARKEPEAKPSKPAADPAADAEKGKKLQAAKRALALDGWKPERIAKLEEDELLEIGEHRAKNQADVNREFARLRSGTPARSPDGTFKAEAKPGEPATAAPTKAEPQTPKPAEQSAAQGDAEIDGVIDAAAQEIGEPATKLLKAITGTLMARVKAAEAKAASRSDEGQAINTELIQSQGRQLVESHYPEQMANPGAFDEVVENFRALAASGRYGPGQLSKVWTDAAFMAFGGQSTVRKAQRDMLARQNAADKGRVDPGRGDTGVATDAPINNTRDALRLAGKMMAENPSVHPDKLRETLMGRVRGNRVA